MPLPDGRVLRVRAVTPADVDGLAVLYGGLSDDDRCLRFFSSARPPRPFFERLATVVDRGGYGVVATVGGPGTHPSGRRASGPPRPDGSRILGEAGYELLANGDGELGMTVAAGERGWLGPYLLDALVEAAAARGVPNLEADVMATNSRMLTLLRSRGYVTMRSHDPSALRIVVGTAGRTPVWPAASSSPAGAGPPRVLVEVPGGRWHAHDEARSAGLQVLACSGPRSPRSRCPALAGRPCPLAAAADTIVVSNVPDDGQWRTIVDRHATLHPGVPVCVEPRSGPPGRSTLAPPEGGAATVVDDDDPHVVVTLVDRLAARHRSVERDRPAADR